jgi:hypothetical protein
MFFIVLNLSLFKNVLRSGYLYIIKSFKFYCWSFLIGLVIYLEKVSKLIVYVFGYLMRFYKPK